MKSMVFAIIAAALSVQASDLRPTGGVMNALPTPEELSQGLTWSIDLLIDPASNPAEILPVDDRLRDQVRETAKKGAAPGCANIRYIYPDQFQFEVWAHRYADAAAVEGSRSRLTVTVTGVARPKGQGIVQGRDACGRAPGAYYSEVA